MAIICPKCGGKVVGYEGYTHKSMNVYERSKRCKEYGCRFTTIEKVGRILRINDKEKGKVVKGQIIYLQVDPEANGIKRYERKGE